MSAGGASKRKARRKRTEERVVVQYEVRYLLSDRDKAPMQHAAVQQLKGEPQQVQALLSKITPEDLGTALHTFDQYVARSAGRRLECDDLYGCSRLCEQHGRAVCGHGRCCWRLSVLRDSDAYHRPTPHLEGAGHVQQLLRKFWGKV